MEYIKQIIKIVLKMSHTRIIVGSFAFIIIIGTILLSLPISMKEPSSANILTSLFTSTSAVCVTGLVLEDTYNHWTLFGQLVILFLIQCGGIGLVTVTTFLLAIFGKKIGYRVMILARESISTFSFHDSLKIVKKIVFVTIFFEFLGALILSTRFVPKFGCRGFYFAIFHSISAFCNAGFDLMGIVNKSGFVSVTIFHNDLVVLYTLSFLIIIGGIGFVVWKDLYDFLKIRTLFFHTKVVVVLTFILLFFGTLFFYMSEYNNSSTMGDYTIIERISNSFFQAATCRTAGYNSFALTQMHEISKTGTIILMFIGGAPGSMAGGVKITTIGIILFTIISQVRGASSVVVFKRYIPQSIINRATTIIGLSGLLILTVTFILIILENLPFVEALFETTSAFGTVGLSLDVTPNLSSNISKVVLVLTMFIGRVGPFSFAISLLMRANNSNTQVIHPKGNIIVG